MKILVITDKNDYRVKTILSPINSIGEVYFIKDKDDEVIKNFSPDIIFSKSIGEPLSLIEEMPPCLNLDIYKKPSVKEKYKCDVAYVGNPYDMDSSLLDLFSLGHSVRVFFHTPCITPIYAGVTDASDIVNIYHNAKFCPINKNDFGYREIDILASEGNPIIYTDKLSFIKKIRNKPDKPKSKVDEILSKNTNFDRIALVLRKLNFNKEANLIMEKKRERCNSI